MKKVIVLLIILVAAACVVGYFFVLKPKKTKAVPQHPVQESPEQKKEQLEAQLAEELKSIKRFAETNPVAIREIEQKVNEFKEKVSPSSTHAIFAGRILTEAKSEFEKRAQKAYSDVKKKADEFLAKIRSGEGPTEGKKKDYTEVIEKINSFPADFAQTDCYTKLREMREQVKSYIEACDAWETHRTDADAAHYKNDLDRALRILNDFPEKYRTSEWEKERQKILAQYQGEKQAATAQQEAEEKMVWHPLYSGESDLRKADWNPDPESAFVVKDGVLTITCPSGVQFVSMTTGADDWAEFILEIDMCIVRGSLMVAVRGTLEGDKHKFDKIDVATGEFESGGWRKLKVRVKENRIKVIAPGLRVPKEDTCERKSGPIGLFVWDGAEVQIKSIKIAFFGQEPASWARRQAAKEEKKPEEKKPEEKKEEKKPEQGK